MAHAEPWVLVFAAVAASSPAAAQPTPSPGAAAAQPAPGPGAAPAPAPAAEEAPAPAAPAPAPAAGEAPAPAQVAPATPAAPAPAQAEPGATPAAAAPAPAQEPPVPTVAPSVAATQQASAGPPAGAEDPTTAPATTPVDAGVRAEDPTQTRFALELVAGLIGSGRFQSDAPGRSTQDAVGGMYGLGAMIGDRSALYGLAVEFAGLGRDHYGSANGSSTVNAAYSVGTLWLQGRWYLSDARPAVYITGAAGPALPFARATGTRPSDNPLVAPPVPYECSETGKVGLGLAAAVGVEFDVARSWSLISDARFAGHVLSSDASQFGTCAPGVGSALSGSVRLGVQLRL